MSDPVEIRYPQPENGFLDRHAGTVVVTLATMAAIGCLIYAGYKAYHAPTGSDLADQHRAVVEVLIKEIRILRGELRGAVEGIGNQHQALTKEVQSIPTTTVVTVPVEVSAPPRKRR